MSRIYDNWERLVAAVLKSEENWQLCHAPSITSGSSDFSPASPSSPDDNNFRSPHLEWVEEYEPGVNFTFVLLHDGTRHLQRVRFSGTRFNKDQALRWWSNNRESLPEVRYHCVRGGFLEPEGYQFLTRLLANRVADIRAQQRRKITEKGKWLQSGFSSKKGYSREERELEWAKAQTTLHGLDPMKTAGFFSKQSYKEVTPVDVVANWAEIERLQELHTLKGHIESVLKAKDLDTVSTRHYHLYSLKME